MRLSRRAVLLISFTTLALLAAVSLFTANPNTPQKLSSEPAANSLPPQHKIARRFGAPPNDIALNVAGTTVLNFGLSIGDDGSGPTTQIVTAPQTVKAGHADTVFQTVTTENTVTVNASQPQTPSSTSAMASASQKDASSTNAVQIMTAPVKTLATKENAAVTMITSRSSTCFSGECYTFAETSTFTLSFSGAATGDPTSSTAAQNGTATSLTPGSVASSTSSSVLAVKSSAPS